MLAVLPATHFKKSRDPNLLFFGSFTQLGEAEYVERLLGEVRDEETAYRLMARDIYQNGAVLQRKKYRLLGYAYRIFLAGLTASFIAIVIQYAS